MDHSRPNGMGEHVQTWASGRQQTATPEVYLAPRLQMDGKNKVSSRDVKTLVRLADLYSSRFRT
jgi:hypothetical protein